MRRRKSTFYDNPGVRKRARQEVEQDRSKAAPLESSTTKGAESADAARVSHGNAWPVQTIVVLVALPIALLLPIARAIGIVGWPWALVLAPFTLAGVVFSGIYVLTVFARFFEPARRMLYGQTDDGAGATAPPEQLEPPLAADAIGEHILVEHPELLAALCLGFRKMRFLPVILGRSVTDPWGIYASALTASSMELEQLHIIARKHTEAFASSPRMNKRGRQSDSEVARHAVEAFRQCAEKSGKRGISIDCTFEHVVAIYGSRVPSRDAHLKSVAPRVRALLEREYPQIRTASLADGTHVKYSEWQKQAAQDRKELVHERKEHERVRRNVDEMTREMADTRSQMETLRASVETARNEARAAARTEQAQWLEEFRAAMERTHAEDVRQVQRLNVEVEKNAALIEALTAERDELERALFSEGAEDEDEALPDGQALAGLRVLLVGGDDRQAKPVRELAESFGVQMVHDDSLNAVQLVASTDIVVFWIRYLRHPKYYAVRRECRVRGARHCYWMRTSPASLVSLLSRTRGNDGTLTG